MILVPSFEKKTRCLRYGEKESMEGELGEKCEGIFK